MRRPRGRAGFTLLEIAVAMAILGMGVVACLQVFGASLRLEESASRRTRAVLAARVAMDGLLSRDVLSERDTGCEPVLAGGFRRCIKIWRDYKEAGVDPDEADESGFVPFGLQVDVTWREGAGHKTYTLRSLTFAEPDDG